MEVSYFFHFSLFIFHLFHFGIISRGRRCESCACGRAGALGWGETGLAVVVFGFTGDLALFTAVFFAGLRLLAAVFGVLGTGFWVEAAFLTVFAVLGTDSFCGKAFFTVFGVSFTAIFFFSGLLAAVLEVSFFMASPFPVILDAFNYNIYYFGWQ